MMPKPLFLFTFLCFVLTIRGEIEDSLLSENSTGADIVYSVVRRIQRSGIFPHDQGFLRRLAFVETRFGEKINKSHEEDHHEGIWQINEFYFNETKTINLSDIHAEIHNQWGVDWGYATWNKCRKPFYSALAARMYFYKLQKNDSMATIPGTITKQARYWKMNYRKDGEETYFAKETEVLERGSTCGGLLDICFVLDLPNSIHPDEFEQAKKFMINLFSTFSWSTTRLGLVMIGTTAEVILDFNTSVITEYKNINSSILDIPWQGGNTNIGAGIDAAVTMFHDVKIKKPEIPKIVVTITDGGSMDGDFSSTWKSVREANLTFFPIAVGKNIAKHKHLDAPFDDKSRVILLEDFDALEEFYYEMNMIICEVPHEPALGVAAVGTLQKKERRYFKFTMPTMGLALSLKFNGTNENLRGWYSYSETTPNSALYNGTLTGRFTLIPYPENLKTNLTASVYITIESRHGALKYTMTATSPDYLPVIISIVCVITGFCVILVLVSYVLYLARATGNYSVREAFPRFF